MRQVLYFHGFASSPHSRKVTSLRELLAPDGIALDTPDLNVPSFERLDFDAMVDLGVARGRANSPRAIVGSSLGSLVALAVAKTVDAPLVLIAPALGIALAGSTSSPPAIRSASSTTRRTGRRRFTARSSSGWRGWTSIASRRRSR